MSGIKQKKALADLQLARGELLAIPKKDLTYAALLAWWSNWVGPISAAGGVAGSMGAATTPIKMELQGREKETDPDLFDAMRDDIVACLDDTAKKVDAKHVVRPILEELILKTKDTKLATLLREFNDTKDRQPNLAAIGFRTIIGLVLVEIAKVRAPNGKVAALKDVSVDKVINMTLDEKFLQPAEAELIKRFQDGAKVKLDIVAHKPTENGERTLIDKDDLSAAVDNLLNHLLKAF
jgi:hypothetical protein